MTDKPLSIQEAADALRVHPSSLRNWERRGRFPQAKRDMNNRRYYTLDDITELRAIIYPPVEQAS